LILRFAVAVKDGRATGVRLESGEVIPCDKVILATGGVTYSFTGSTGDGLTWAEKAGHKIVPIRPGLVLWSLKEIILNRWKG